MFHLWLSTPPPPPPSPYPPLLRLLLTRHNGFNTQEANNGLRFRSNQAKHPFLSLFSLSLIVPYIFGTLLPLTYASNTKTRNLKRFILVILAPELFFKVAEMISLIFMCVSHVNGVETFVKLSLQSQKCL